MKERIVSILKRWPPLYRFVVRIYYELKFERIAGHFTGTRAQERNWAGKPISESYWANRDLPMTHFLAEEIAKMSPVQSILEVGCASGPNLYQVAKRFPQAQIRGIDINKAAVDYGNEQFAREGLFNVRLSVGKADALGEFPDRSFDIVFSNAVLIYIGPDKIQEVIQGMLRVARQALVLVELYQPSTGKKDPNGLGVWRNGHWVRDYAALIKPLDNEAQIKITKIPVEVWPGEPWREMGYIIEVIRSGR